MRVVLTVTVAMAIGLTGVARAGEPAPPPPAPDIQPVPAPAPVEDTLGVYVLTFGPGDHPFFAFGHDAILVRDKVAGTDRVYNFGTFRFDSPGLIGEFLKGRLTYWLSVSSFAATRAVYEHENRSILVQELALPPQDKQQLRARLDENARPDKREYKYDYFLDNCSTRVRDAIDLATGGALRAAARAPGRLTLREQALRMTAPYPWLYVAIDLVLAGSTDRPIDRWGEMYIPEELAHGMRAVTLPISGGAAPRPLVASEQVLFVARRPPPLVDPPARFVTLLLIGLAIGLVFLGLGWSSRRPPVRVVFGVLIALWGLIVGFLGCFLIYAWWFTDHVVTHRNENIFLCAPWAVSLFALGLGVTFGSRRAQLAALRVSVSALLFALLGWGLKAHPAFHQHNAMLIALLLPPWAGISAGLLHSRHQG